MLSVKIRTIIFVLMAGVTVGLCQLFPNAATNPEAGLVMWLPSDYRGLVGTREEMSPQEIQWLPEDTTQLKMVYRDPLGPDEGLESLYRSISATLILAGADPRSLHRPEVCMPAQGWQIVKREVVPVETEGGPLEVMDLHLLRYWQKENGDFYLDDEGNKIKQRAHYVYWLVGRDGSTPHYWQMKLQGFMNNAFKNINDRWGYPSVMIWVDERLGDERGEEVARERYVEFIREVAPHYQKSLGAVDREDAVPLKTLR
ncbi:MAG: exosortase-associated EpsI family protein [Verrucomicrobiales bacterium]